MVNAIRFCSYSSKFTCLISLTCLLISGYFFVKIQFRSSKSHYNRLIVLTNNHHQTSKQTNSISSQSDTYSSYICDEQGPADNHSSTLRSYCSKIPVPLNGWTRAARYAQSDIAFLIVSSSNSHQRSITAVRDTWLTRVTHKYFPDEISSSQLSATRDDTDSARKTFFQSL